MKVYSTGLLYVLSSLEKETKCPELVELVFLTLQYNGRPTRYSRVCYNNFDRRKTIHCEEPRLSPGLRKRNVLVTERLDNSSHRVPITTRERSMIFLLFLADDSGEHVAVMHPLDVFLQVGLLVCTEHAERATLLLVLAAEYLLVLDQVSLPFVAFQASEAGVSALLAAFQLPIFERVVGDVSDALGLFLLLVPISLVADPVLDVLLVPDDHAFRRDVLVERVEGSQRVLESLFRFVEIQRI